MRRFAVALIVAAMGLASVDARAAAPTVSVTVTPSTGTFPYTANVAWTSTGATACAAVDGWSGTKALSGSQQVTVTAQTDFSIICAASDGIATLNWKAPTTNSDGSTLTDNAGYNIYRGTTATNLVKVKSVGPTVLTYADTGLASGSYYYQMTTVNASSNESAKGNAAPFPIQVVGSNTKATATAKAATVPSPPDGVTVTTVNVNVSVTVN